MKKLPVLTVWICITQLLNGQHFIQQIEHDFRNYTNQFLTEKIYIHTDRDFYLTGENIWFKSYVVNGSDHGPLDISKVAYIEIIDKDNKPVLQTSIPLRDGTGPGSLFIPATINSGNYILRAYTRWMRNYPAVYYFSKVITIVNPFKPLDPCDTEKNKGCNIQFFPEGGTLVNGLRSKISFKFSDNYRKWKGLSGILLTDQGDTIGKFQSPENGIGSFYYTPVKNINCKAIFYDSLNTVIAENYLPVASDKGYVMCLDDGTKKITINVHHTQTSDNYLYMLMNSRNTLTYSGSCILKDSIAFFSVENEKIPDGISHIALFNDKKELVCERLFFKKPALKNNISGKTDNTVYKTRNKVMLDLTLNTLEKESTMSLSVYRVDTLLSSGILNINDYLLLNSGFCTGVQPFLLPDGPDEEKFETIDNLMLTCNLNSFDWNTIFTGKKPDFKYIPEYLTQVIQGVITDKITGAAVPGIMTYLTIPDTNFTFNSALSNEDGKFFFEMNDFYGSGELIIQTDYTKDTVYNIMPDPIFSGEFPGYYLPPFHLSEKFRQELLTRSINMQTQSIFHGNEIRNNNETKTDHTMFYGNPDEKYFLNDFTQFYQMEDILREYVTGVYVRKKNDNFRLLIPELKTNYVLGENPLVMIDGLPVFNVNDIMNFDPSNIKRLDIVRKRYYYKQSLYPGIVSFASYDGDLANFQVNSEAQIFNYEGFQVNREFTTPRYDSQQQIESRIPDFRDLLLWEPEIKTDETGKAYIEFFTSDHEGSYVIEVQGLTRAGEPIEFSLDFMVK